jgi:hypothetical protein
MTLTEWCEFTLATGGKSTQKERLQGTSWVEEFHTKFAQHYRGDGERQFWGYAPATRHRAEKIRSGRDQTNNVRSNNK